MPIRLRVAVKEVVERWHINVRLMSLTNKVLAFFLPLLIVQIVLLALMVKVNQETKAELEKSNQARNISDAINKISKDSLEIFSSFGGDPEALKNFSKSDPMFPIWMERLKTDYDQLEEFARHEPELLAKTRSSRADASRILQELMQAKDLHSQPGSSGREQEKAKWKSIRATLKTVLKDELSFVGKQHEESAKRSIETQALLNEQTQKLLVSLIVIDLLFVIFAAILFTKTITKRLLIMCDNTTRLAANAPLNAPFGGTDELGKLDIEFHRMAAAIRSAAKKENAIITNARDMICSLDSDGRVVRANPASARLLRIDPDDLIGRYLVDLVVNEDAPKMVGYLSSLKSKDDVDELEIAMKVQGGETVETLWSANWSDEEQSHFIVIHDISERRRAEQLRREVTAMVTHDLRSPLMTISNILDFFQRGLFTTTEPKGQDFLKSATRNANRMTALINDLLDIEKINAGMMTLKKTAVPVEHIFATVEEMNAATATERGVKLFFDANCLAVDADEERIVRVVQNLVSNALKFSPADTKIEIKAVALQKEIEISVRDQGTGIAPDEVAHVFDRYRQVGKSAKDIPTGSGLGLAICKSIVELHGGQISVESENGKGSVFKFTLPAAARDGQ